MGSGKSTIGRIIATRLGRHFVDNDVVLEQRAGATAAEIARDRGVDALHADEAAVLRDALDADHAAVITAAASTVTDASLRSRLHDGAFVVWLTAAPETLARRTATGTADRPELDADPLALAEHQRLERDPLFAQVADLLVATDGSVESVVDDVLANLPADA
jgi:shikimate kinase